MFETDLRYYIDELALITEKIDLANSEVKRAEKITIAAGYPYPTPMKFMLQSEKNNLISAIFSAQKPVSKIWILPWEEHEKPLASGNSGADIICAIDPEKTNDNLLFISDDILSSIRKNFDNEENIELHLRCVWKNILETYIPNEVLPTYFPDWENSQTKF